MSEERIPTIGMKELGVGDRVAFGRPESTKDPAVGVITKVNRVTYQIELTKPWQQVRRTYHQGAKFRCSKGMVWRHLAPDFEDASE